MICRQTGSIPLIEDWSDWRNLLTVAFYSSLFTVVALAILKRHVIAIDSPQLYQYFTVTSLDLNELSFFSQLNLVIWIDPKEGDSLELFGDDSAHGAGFESLLSGRICYRWAHTLPAQVHGFNVKT